MRVTYDWQDASNNSYKIIAEVPVGGSGKISVISIVTDDDIELDFHDNNDFSDDERVDILWLAKREGEELENSEDPLADDEWEEDDDDNQEEY